MKVISHRGNLLGPDLNTENTISQINLCIEKGFDVEIDLWFTKNHFYLGHNAPQYIVDLDFLLENSKFLWIHTKNLDAMWEMQRYKDINYFWHQNDDYTLTSKGFIWAYPNKITNKSTIIVDVNLNNKNISENNCFGICTDFPVLYHVNNTR